MDNFTDSKDFKIRFSLSSDEVYLEKFIMDESTRLWYPPSSKVDVVSFIRNWIGFSVFKSSLTATYLDDVVGASTIFLMPYIKVRHICMMYIVVSPEFRRRGIGSSLVKNIKHLAKSRFGLEYMYCELWEGCPLMGLLEKSGFGEIFRQENFVMLNGSPTARVIMQVTL